MLVTLDTLRLDGDPGDSEREERDKAQQEHKLPLTHYFYTKFPRHLYCLTIYTFLTFTREYIVYNPVKKKRLMISCVGKQTK